MVRKAANGHSTWLDALVQYGLLGGVWFFLIVFSVGRQIWRAIRMRPGDLLAKAFMIAYLSYLIFGIINTVMMDVVFFFFLYGGALALQRQSRLVSNVNALPSIQLSPPEKFTETICT